MPLEVNRQDRPPNQPWEEVYAKVAGEMDASIAEFDAELGKKMAKFDKIAGGS